MIELCELNPHKMTTPREKAQCLSWFIETQSDVQTQQNYRSMEETHHHVLQFVYCTRNLWRQGQCSIQRVGNQAHLKKTSSM